MDFTIFDHAENMAALIWLGRKDWMIYRDIPEQRAISAKPRKLYFRPKEPINFDSESPIPITDKEFKQYPPEMWIVLKEIINALDYDAVGTLWYNTLSKALADGPKIFKPTTLQCEALQNAEAMYAFKDYKQPFPVIILDIPEEYRQQLQKKYKIDESPKYVLVNHDNKNRFITVNSFYNKSNVITHITPDRSEYSTIEESLVINRSRREIQNTEGEFDAAENVQRLGINFAMMMSLYTVKVDGPLDPQNYKIWQKQSRAVQRGVPTKKALEAKNKLAVAMQVIKFDQKVEFYDEIEESNEVAQGVDIEKLHKSPRSHWRRGHFVMQPFGVGRRERKVIFRKPVLIRAKYFLGDIKDSSVTYTMHPGRNSNKEKTSITTQEPKLLNGQKIEIVNAEECSMAPGTQGKVVKIIDLGSNMIQIDAQTDDGQKFSLISPPDEFRKI